MSFDPYEPPVETSRPEKEAGAGLALGLGIFAMIAWLLPIIGGPVAGFGLYRGIKGLKGKNPSMATVAIVLCGIALALTAVNMLYGMYLAITGQHPLVNPNLMKGQ